MTGPDGWRMIGPAIAAAAILGLAAGCGSGPAPDDPDLPGPWPVASRTEEIPVPTAYGSFEIRLILVLPDGAGPGPLVLFTHGFSAAPEGYLGYAERLASHGIPVVLPKMPASFFTPTPHRTLAAILGGVLDWATGAGGQPGGPLEGLIAAGPVGLAGHSLGGKLSMLLASTDDRIGAVFGLDPVDSGPPTGGDAEEWPSVTPERMPDIRIPLALAGETVDSGQGGSALACAPGADNFQAYFEHAAGPAIEIDYLGANHVSFVEGCDELCRAFCRPGSDDPEVTRSLARKHMAAFFRLHLLGESGCGRWLTGAGMRTDAAAGLAAFRIRNGYPGR